MTYSVHLIMGAIAALALLAAGILGIVLAVQKKWGGVLICTTVLLFAILVIGATGVSVVMKGMRDAKAALGAAIEGAEKAQAQHAYQHQKRIAELKALTPDVDWANIDPAWGSNSGDPGWSRTPMRWPYEMQAIDPGMEGLLCRNVSQGRSNGGVDTAQLVHRIEAYAFDSQLCIYRTAVARGRATKWAIFHFDTEVNEEFDSEEAMWNGAKVAGWKDASELHTIKERFEEYWQEN